MTISILFFLCSTIGREDRFRVITLVSLCRIWTSNVEYLWILMSVISTLLFLYSLSLPRRIDSLVSILTYNDHWCSRRSAEMSAGHQYDPFFRVDYLKIHGLVDNMIEIFISPRDVQQSDNDDRDSDTQKILSYTVPYKSLADPCHPLILSGFSRNASREAYMNLGESQNWDGTVRKASPEIQQVRQGLSRQILSDPVRFA